MRTQSILRGIIAVFASATVVLAAVPAAQASRSDSPGSPTQALAVAPASSLAPGLGCGAANPVDVVNEAQLRTAIETAADGADICFTSDITLTAPLPLIDDTDLAIDGDAKHRLSLGGFGALEANYSGGDIEYLRIIGLTISGGDDSGAVVVTGSAKEIISLQQVIIENNSSADANAGGGVTMDSVGSALVYDSTFRGNSAAQGGGLFVRNSGVSNIFRSTFEGNTSTGSGGGARVDNTNSIIRNSTFVGNTAASDGGGLDLEGKGHTIRYVTVTGNTAAAGGGISVRAGASYDLDNVIVNENTAPVGADIDASGAGAGTIDNASFTSAAAVNGIAITPGTNGVIVGDPQLCPLADNGGPTRTRAPEIGSPVLDAGPGIPGITKDQRGEARSSLAVDKVDIGAVEGTGSCGAFQAPADPAPVASPPSAPLNVTARLKVGRIARIVWDPPASSGTFPVTNYLVQASTGGGTCLAVEPVRTCDIPGVVPGVTYTYRVQALNGAGWGPFSAPSNAVTWGALFAPISEPNEPGGIDDVDKPIDPLNPNDPQDPDNPGDPSDPDNPGDPANPNDPDNPGDPSDPANPGNPSDPANPGDPEGPGQPGLGPTPTIMIIGAREDPRRVTATGYTSDIPVGVRVIPWRKVTGMRDFERGTGIRRLLPDESFEWQRRIRATRTITFYFTALDGVSNRLTITPNGRVSP